MRRITQTIFSSALGAALVVPAAGAAGVVSFGAASATDLSEPVAITDIHAAESTPTPAVESGSLDHWTAVAAVQTAPPLDPAVLGSVTRSGGLPVDAEGTACPVEDLRVAFREPGDGYVSGAFVAPLGPAPDAWTTQVNGVVLCRGSSYAFLGFEAYVVDGAWQVGFIPDPEGGLEEGEHEHDANDPDTGAPEVDAAVEASRTGSPLQADVPAGSAIEGYAQYEAQSTCDPTAKPGTVALRTLLLTRYPGTRSLGITRACSVGGRSEHKEGRAFDWGANLANPNEAAAVDDFLNNLLATDEAGNRHAVARRMGIMYVIWNRQIWSAYNASGWRPYSGSSPHTDHVHFSLSWAGARGETSFWDGTVVDGLPDSQASSNSGGTRTARHHADTAADDELIVAVARRWDGHTDQTSAAAADGASERQHRRAARSGERRSRWRERRDTTESEHGPVVESEPTVAEQPTVEDQPTVEVAPASEHPTSNDEPRRHRVRDRDTDGDRDDDRRWRAGSRRADRDTTWRSDDGHDRRRERGRDGGHRNRRRGG